MSAPKPVSRTNFTEAGCEISIRYPVAFERGVETDEEVLERLLAETAKEPRLPLAPGGAPKLQPIGA